MDQPALQPPTGSHAILDNPPNSNDLATGVALLCLVVATTAFLIRLFSRVHVIKRVWVDDFFILAGYGLYIGYIYCIFCIIHDTGFFVHQWNLRKAELPDFLHTFFICENIYVVEIACVKAAILIEWIRVFVPFPTRNWFFYSCWALLITNSFVYASAIITQNLLCTPYRKTWDDTVPGYCHTPFNSAIKTPVTALVSSFFDLVSDVAILVLPQQVIWRLKMPTRRRIGISVVFAFGLSGCIAASFRVAATISLGRSVDVTYTASPVLLWALAEMTGVLLVACVPAAPKLIRTLWVDFMSLGSTWARIKSPETPMEVL
ncbi:hypothetical protein F5Y16DRAFT_366977 [Xylariaceae sp. FL0255]|nr:hypothetical protein F5Y16DRAFT_366977 [Xylariaceae sp. FL0255]